MEYDFIVVRWGLLVSLRCVNMRVILLFRYVSLLRPRGAIPAELRIAMRNRLPHRLSPHPCAGAKSSVAEHGTSGSYPENTTAL